MFAPRAMVMSAEAMLLIAMAENELENGRRYFCREETSGRGHCGIFHIDDDDMVAELHAFDEHLSGGFDDLLVVRLENNSIVSLHDNIAGRFGNSDLVSKTRVSSVQVSSNRVVVGSTAWGPNDQIRRVDFLIEHADGMLRHAEKFRTIANADFGDIPDTTVFELSVDGMTIKAWYTATGSVTFNRPTDVGMRYGIEFDQPRDLKSYMPDMLKVVHFVSAALGHRFVPSGINVSPLTMSEFEAAIEAKAAPRDYSVRYIWPVKAPANSLWVGRSFAYAGDDIELTAFVSCLHQWVDRDTEWHGASSLMMAALGTLTMMSGERLMNACSWLEEIPGAGSAMAVSDEDINAIAAVAASEAEKRGHKDYKARIAGVIRGQLKKESNTERFERLHKAVCARFGEDALNGDVVPHLLNAMKYRGRVAHGHFEIEIESDYQAFAKSVYAMEALCYLLTIKDLPMSTDGAKRAVGQLIVSNYRNYHIES